MDIIKSLEDFIEVAGKNRKYPKNSVYGYRAALKLFNEEVNSEERESVDLLKERLEQIYSNILNEKKNDFSIASLEVYKKRMKKIISDYEKYGVDPSKMANWNPPVRGKQKSKEKQKAQAKKESSPDELSDEPSLVSVSGNNRHEYSLRPLKKILISYPPDFTLEEARSIRSFADYLVSMRNGEHSDK